MGIEMRVEGLEQFSDLQHRLRAAGRHGLLRKIRKEFRQAARPVENDLRAAALRVRMHRGNDVYAQRAERVGAASEGRSGSTGFRARLARSITTSTTRRGIRIKASARRFGQGDYGITLPRRSDPEAGRRKWRHPVFGNREVWVEQVGTPWFFRTVRPHRDTFRRAVGRAIDETIRELERG